MDVIPDLTVWGLALPILVAAIVMGVVLPRYLGSEKSWGPLNCTAVFVVGYVVAIGVMMYVDILLLHMADGKFANMEWFAFLTLYWPMWIAYGVPIVFFVVFGVHMWPGKRPGVAYLAALVMIVAGLQVAATTDGTLLALVAVEVLLGLLWVAIGRRSYGLRSANAI